MKSLEKQLKRYLKRRYKINLSLLVTFLITGQIGYSLDISEDWINDKTINETVQILGQEIIIINNGTINVNFDSDSDSYSSGNGILISNDSNSNINNNGTIFGISNSFFSDFYNSGNGILISNDSNSNINNNGTIFVISNSSGSSSSGNGILNNNNNSSSINNNGTIVGISNSSGSSSSGNGILINNSGSSNVNNNGTIAGDSFSSSDSYTSGNGILISNGSVNNNGTIIGNSHSYSDFHSGNGILNRSYISKSSGINNNGTIIGNSDSHSDFHSGNGILNNSYNIKNSGIILGSNYSIAFYGNGSNHSVINSGILVGKNILNTNVSDYTNNGLEILLSDTGEIKEIVNGSNSLFKDGKNIINTQRYDENGNKTEESNKATDSYILSSKLKDYNNLIINGAGINTGALVIDKNTTIDESIINGYETAVYLKGENSLQATNTIFNGGGLKVDKAVIVGDNDNNLMSILGNSIINGDVNLGDGDDNLSIATSTQINGDLIGGIGEDTLNFTNSNTQLNILHNISDFENININGNSTLFESTIISGAENINLASGILTLRIDSNKKDSDGKVIGHSLYKNSGVINSNGGTLSLGLNGLGKDTIISMGETSINPSLDTNLDSTDKLIVTDSIVLDATLVDGSNGKDIKISVIDRLVVDPLTMGPELYDHLNKSYKSIISSGELGKLANTTSVDRIPETLLAKISETPIKTYDDAMAGLLGILDQISANNPYAYTLKSGRDSLKLFEDNMSYLTIKPNNNEWIVQGKAIYTGVKVDNEASGKGYYGFDTGHRNYKTTTNTVGGLATFEYGLSNKSSLGLVFGGNNQDVSFRGPNSIDGNSLYVGSFIKTEKNQFKFMTGLGYQYTSNDVDRSVSNKYDSFKTDEKYDVNSLNVFVEGKYSINIDNQWIMEPKIKLSYYFVNQDKIDEGYSADQLSIGVDKFATNTGDIEIGFDLKKEVLYSKGKLNNILSFGVINTIGSKDEDLEAYVIGKDVNGSKFNIQGVELPTTSGKVAYNMEFEQPNGIIYSAGVNFEFAKDNNRNVNATLGLGYRF